MREVLGPNLRRLSIHSDCGSAFFFCLQGNAGLASRVDHDNFLHSRLHFMFLTVDTKI